VVDAVKFQRVGNKEVGSYEHQTYNPTDNDPRDNLLSVHSLPFFASSQSGCAQPFPQNLLAGFQNGNKPFILTFFPRRGSKRLPVSI
jgi:hypothetical protein